MESVKVQVQCSNPYFRGKVEGVQFKQQTGGAVGLATPAQAREIVTDKAFTCPDLQAAPADEPKLTDLKGIGQATARKLADAGIRSVADLAKATPKIVAESIQESEETCAAWQAEAQQLLIAE